MKKYYIKVTKQIDDYSLEIKIKIFQENKENGLNVAEFIKKTGPSIDFFDFINDITKEVHSLEN